MCPNPRKREELFRKVLLKKCNDEEDPLVLFGFVQYKDDDDDHRYKEYPQDKWKISSSIIVSFITLSLTKKRRGLYYIEKENRGGFYAEIGFLE